jgi:hypothetical protein
MTDTGSKRFFRYNACGRAAAGDLVKRLYIQEKKPNIRNKRQALDKITSLYKSNSNLVLLKKKCHVSLCNNMKRLSIGGSSRNRGQESEILTVILG